MCHRRVPAYVEDVQKCFKEAHSEAPHQFNNEAKKREIMINIQAQSN